MNPEKCVIVCDSIDNEDGPVWNWTMRWPSEVEGDLFNHLRDFFLLVITVEEIEFYLADDGRVLSTGKYNGIAPEYYRQITGIIETHFQNVLTRITHQEWDKFKVTWYPIDYPQHAQKEWK